MTVCVIKEQKISNNTWKKIGQNKLNNEKNKENQKKKKPTYSIAVFD